MNMYLNPIPWNVTKTETASIVIVHTLAASMPYAATACIITGGVDSCRPAIFRKMQKRPMTDLLTISSVYGKKTKDHG